MPRISLWKDGAHTNDYRFFDRRIKEMFTVGGTGINVHKYLGIQNQGQRALMRSPIQSGAEALGFLKGDPEAIEKGKDATRTLDNFTGTLVGECGLPVISSENETRCAATIIARLLFHKNGPIMKGLEIVEVRKK